MFGRDPNPNEECTGDQLTGLSVLPKRDTDPYVDSGVWGPLKTIKISGPTDMFTWFECCELPTTALVGFDAVGLAPLLDYLCLITDSAGRYGPLTWPLLYHCDVRCRLEHMECLQHWRSTD